MISVSCLTAASALVLSSSFASPYPEVVGPPATMTALGDSITCGTNTSTDDLGRHPELSWSTGTESGITSHRAQLAALGPAPTANNRARCVGATMQGMGPQVTEAIADAPQYVTVLIGGNDACGEIDDGRAVMTEAATYRQQFEEVMASLAAGLPDAKIFVASVPDLYLLWESLHTHPDAVEFWETFTICPALLFNPESTASEDVARRNAVRQRVVEYNQALEDVCAQYLHCRFDQHATFDLAFTAEEVSSADYFHPSRAGQSRLGATTFPVSFDFTDLTAPVTTASITLDGDDAVLELTATDAEGVRGIEYRREGDARWTRYQSPLTVPGGSFAFFRAVDLNGNTEAAQRYPLDDGDGGILPVDGGLETDAGVDGGDGGPDESEPPGGCGCGSAGGVPVGALVLGVMALLQRRRR